MGAKGPGLLMRFVVLCDGRLDTLEMRLDEAAERVASGYRAGQKIEARVVTTGGWRLLTKKETEALATAAAGVLHG